MNDKIAKFISGVSSPFVMVFVFGLRAIAVSVKSTHDFLVFGGLCVFLVSLLPFFYILLQVKLGKITDIHVAVREQRAVPFVVATCGAVILTITYRLLNAPQNLVALAVALIVSGIVFGVISGFWKISIHSAAYTGAVIIVAFIVNFQLLLLLLFLPIIIWARLVRKKHSVLQSIIASLLNAFCVAATLSLMLH
jgi:uncharacterized RDD family membrane protein YckC